MTDSIIKPGRFAMALALAVLSTACADLAPRYARPAAPVPTRWPAAAPALAKGSASRVDEPAVGADPAHPDAPRARGVARDLAWRDFFVDERLRRVIALALANNRDLRVAALKVEQARAQYRVQDAARWPTVDASASASRQSAGGAASNNVSVSLGLAAYELDFFGRVKNLGEAARQSYLATDEDRRTAQISLVAEVATAWLTLGADLERLDLAQRTLASQQATYDLRRRQHDLGAVNGLVLVQTQTTVDAARVDVAGYSAQLTQDRNALVLLLGADLPDDLAPARLAEPAGVVLDVPAGLPSAVLQQRPDVLSAEHALQSANADIGVARAAFFPTIALTAGAGSASSELSGLFKAGSRTWSFSPSITLPIFDAGGTRANLDAKVAARDIALAQYEKAIQTAFAETADALVVRASLVERIAAQRSLTDANDQSLQMSEALYRTGGTGYLDVLTAQRSLYAAQQSLITLRLAEQSNRVTLYKVLGGGWQPAN